MWKFIYPLFKDPRMYFLNLIFNPTITKPGLTRFILYLYFLSFFHLPVNMSIYCLHRCLPTCLHVYIAVCLSIHMYICLFSCPSPALPVWLSVYLSTYLAVCLPVYLFGCLSTCLPRYPSTCPSIYMSICLPVCPPVYLFTCGQILRLANIYFLIDFY